MKSEIQHETPDSFRTALTQRVQEYCEQAGEQPALIMMPTRIGKSLITLITPTKPKE